MYVCMYISYVANCDWKKLYKKIKKCPCEIDRQPIT